MKFYSIPIFRKLLFAFAIYCLLNIVFALDPQSSDASNSTEDIMSLNFKPQASIITADSINWSSTFPSSTPSSRLYPAMAYDAENEYTLLFGGQDENNSYFNDTWKWTGSTWEKINPLNSPTARTGHALSYDSYRKRIVLFGGFDGNWVSDTWEWDGINWSPKSPLNVPPASTGHSMAFDSLRNKTVLFGGFTSDYLAETWEWDGTNWVKKNPMHSPPARAHAGLVFDSGRGKILLFGGYQSTGDLQDTWYWDGIDWTQVISPNQPNVKSFFSFAFDSSRERAVLFGVDRATYSTTVTWEFDGSNWSHRYPPASPTPRSHCVTVYDSKRFEIVLYGGRDYSSNILTDTWFLKGLQIRANPDYRLTIPGSSVNYSISGRGTTSNITLTISGLPSEISYALSPANNFSPPTDVTLSLTPSISSPNNYYYATVSAEADGFSVSLEVALEIIAPDFVISTLPPYRNLYQGETNHFLITVTKTETFIGVVDLSLVGLPSGISGEFSSTSITPTTSTDLQIYIGLDVAPGDYTFLIYGTSGSIVHNIEIILHIFPASIQLDISPTSKTIYQEEVTTYSILTSSTPGISPQIALNVVGLDDVPYAFSQNPVLAGQTALLNIQTTTDTPNRTYSFNVQGSSGEMVDSMNGSLIILQASMSMALNPPKRTILQGQITSFSIVITATPAYSKPIYLSLSGLDDTQATFSTNPVLPGQTTILSIATSAETAIGDRNFSIFGTSSGLSFSSIGNLTVNKTIITLSSIPVSKTVNLGQSTTFQIPVDATPGFTNPIQLSAQGYGNLNVDFSLNPVLPGNVSTFHIYVPYSVNVGTYVITIEGNVNGLVGSTSLILKVRSRIFAPIIYNRYSPIPYTPVLIPISSPEAGNYSLNWFDQSIRNADIYQVQESQIFDFSSGISNVCYTPSLNCNIIGKLAGTYYYRVRGQNSLGYGDWSNTQTAIVLPPGTPVISTINNSDGDESYIVSWSFSPRTSYYQLEESNNPDFVTSSVVYSGSLSTWTANNKSYGTYYYRIKAFGSTGQSSWSNVQSVQVPAPSPGVTVLPNFTTFTTSSYRYVVGEIYNNTSSFIRFVEIRVNFYQGAQLTATDYTFTHLENVHPGEKACFKIILENNFTYDTFGFEPVDYWTDGIPRPQLSITTHSSSIYYGSYRIIGQIRNDESTLIRFVDAVATLYNNQNKVLDCDYSFVGSTDLNPQQVSSFTIYADPPDPNQVVQYRLQTDGMRP